MDRVASQPTDYLSALFSITSERMGISSPTIPEKDFWVCWTLSKLFGLSGIPRLLFKGGTSLSKAFGLIDRFSEDIDLSLSRDDLGFGGLEELLKVSRAERDRQIAALRESGGREVREKVLPALQASFGSVSESLAARLRAVDADRGQVDIEFDYPRAFEADSYGSYLGDGIKLEIGATSDHEPSSQCRVRSYAADHRPEAFEIADVEVRVLAPERTFWEKATIFHSENHRAVRNAEVPASWQRISRHAYDLFMLDRKGISDRALARVDLLDQVARYKQVFFYAGWSQYDKAKPGTFLLAPNELLEKQIRRDYERMRIMFFESPPAPAIEEVLDGLRDLEARINRAV